MIARSNLRKGKCSCLLKWVLCFGVLSSTFAKGPLNSLTFSEQASYLALARQGASTPTIAKTQYLDNIEKAIKGANSKAGFLDKTFRSPVSSSQLRRLQMRAWLRGQFVSFKEISAATDTAHKLMREMGPTSKNQSLAKKILDLTNKDRPNLYGEVAELAESRKRGCVLTKNKQSPSFDITEAKLRPKNYQVKFGGGRNYVYGGILEDIQSAGKNPNGTYRGRGITDKANAQKLVKAGKWKKVGRDLYEYVDHKGVRVETSRSFSRSGLARKYFSDGRKSLSARGLESKGKNDNSNGSAKRGNSSRFVRGLKVLGWIGLGVGVIYEGYQYHKWYKGDLTKREGIAMTAKSASGLAAGLAGGYAGAALGAKAGASIGVWFAGAGAGPGAFIGSIVGGIGGGFAAAWAGSRLAEYGVNRYYNQLDERQARQVEQFIYNHYATP